jgi:hypothetical protein
MSPPATEPDVAPLDGRTLLLRQAGAFADDETLPLLRASIYEARGRPEAYQDPREGSRTAL